MPRKKNTCMYLVAALLFLGGLGYLVFSGLSENTVYFLNVSEARAATADKLPESPSLRNLSVFQTYALQHSPHFLFRYRSHFSMYLQYLQ